MKPIIGIVSRPNTSIMFNRPVMSVLEGYRMSVAKCGGIPIAILPTQNFCYEEISPKYASKLSLEEQEDIKRQIDMCNGIIMPGGNRMYDYDFFILKYALEKDIPILGTCMGMQLMACNSMNSEDRTQILKKIDSNIIHNQMNVKYVHKVKLEKDSKLFNIIGEEIIDVNSRHKFVASQVGNLTISAVSEDGFIEGVEYPNKKFAIGVQWHPEDMVQYDKKEEKLMQAFIKVCEN